MPRNKRHAMLTKLLLDKGFEELHRQMDAPSQQMGYKHRKVRHGLFEVLLNSFTYGVDGLKATLLHIAQDTASTLSKEAVREILEANDKEEMYRTIITQMDDASKRMLLRALQEQKR